ncbi:MAG: N-formylglutamate amidohydrolase, partial [Acidobacteriota bacterium]|nr:N-formylglutamate amidohydrolase [Acidobacteriota bacterium]
ALAVARGLARPEEIPELAAFGDGGSRAPVASLIVRGLVPRTFVDLNRELDRHGDDLRAANLTLAIPPYIRPEEDLETLAALHGAYHEAVALAYEAVCGRGGIAIQLHTYAPRSVRIDEIGDDIVTALRAAYAPERYDTWPRRPDVDLITATPDDTALAPALLVAAIRRRFERTGIVVAENATYTLHPGTTGHRHAAKYPGQVLCLEINRERLADPFVPFAPMRIGPRKVRRMTTPIVAGILDVLDPDGR